MYRAYVNGACQPNPGKGAYGFIFYNKFGKEIYREHGPVGNYTTNNIAEYTAVIKALEYASNTGIQKLHIFSDSLLVVNQLNEIHKVKNLELQKLHRKVMQLAQKFSAVKFEHISREKNKQADKLANSYLNATDSRRKKAEELSEKVFVKTDLGYLYVKENTIYQVDLVNLTCTCPDNQNRGGLCKHIMAAQVNYPPLKGAGLHRRVQG